MDDVPAPVADDPPHRRGEVGIEAAAVGPDADDPDAFLDPLAEEGRVVGDREHGDVVAERGEAPRRPRATWSSVPPAERAGT